MDNSARIEALEATGIASKNSFAASLIAQWQQKAFLSEKQWYYVDKLTREAGGSNVAKREEVAEQVFDGKEIQKLLVTAAASLKRPKLRFATDNLGQIVFSYVADVDSKWFGATFIDNGARSENKKRYGFIGSNGSGSLRRESSPEIKAVILKIAKDPVNEARLSGQKYRYCCFCGQELVNKSSVHHGYGPICADKYNLPWGDTGDLADEEAAAEAELKHIQLQDLE